MSYSYKLPIQNVLLIWELWITVGRPASELTHEIKASSYHENELITSVLGTEKFPSTRPLVIFL